jgi:hypothetical protein
MPAGGQSRRMLMAARRRRERTGTRRGRLLSATVWPVRAGRRWWGSRSGPGRRLLGAGLVAVMLIAGLAVWLSLGRGAPPPRARQYQAYTACLLTGPDGLADPPASRVWAGLEDASAATRAKVQSLPVMSGDSEAAAQPYLAGLLQRHCNLIAAVGAPQVAAVAALASRYPSVRFLAVGGRAAGRNVTALGAADAGLRSAVDNVVKSASGQ